MGLGGGAHRTEAEGGRRLVRGSRPGCKGRGPRLTGALTTPRGRPEQDGSRVLAPRPWLPEVG